MYSGGAGSWEAARRTIESFGEEGVHLLFTDTMIEDQDLYRFLIQSAGKFYGIKVMDLVVDCRFIPEIYTDGLTERKRVIRDIAEETNDRIPNLHWEYDGRDPWELFFEEKYIGNSRYARCSHVLKQDTARHWIEREFEPGSCSLVFGIDWSELHRKAGVEKGWSPYDVEFPLCLEPLVDKNSVLSLIRESGIEPPRLYAQGFTHNNCGGFCVRGGQAHFVNLYMQNKELYLYHERKEQELIERIGKDVSILTSKPRRGPMVNITLRDLRRTLEESPFQIDSTDIGGCGCFVGS